MGLNMRIINFLYGDIRTCGFPRTGKPDPPRVRTGAGATRDQPFRLTSHRDAHLNPSTHIAFASKPGLVGPRVLLKAAQLVVHAASLHALYLLQSSLGGPPSSTYTTSRSCS